MRPPEQPEPPVYSKWERRGSAVAHASGLLLGVPTLFLLSLPLAIAFLPNPVLAYMIARSFRRRRLAWGSFQGMQASVMHLVIVFLAFVPTLTVGTTNLFAALVFLIVALLFLYSLWAAWDTLLGHDFRYIGIGNFLDRVSRANLARQDARRGLFRPYRTDGQDDQPPR